MLNKTSLMTYAVLTILAFVYLLPFWSVLTTALKSDMEVRMTIPIVPPSNPTMMPLLKAFELMKQGLVNSLLFTSFATLFSSLIGSVNGFILSKVKFKYSNVVFLALSVGIFIPYHAVIIPLITVTSKAGVYNSILGMTIVHTTYGIPICTLFFKNFFDELPESILNAARIDGASDFTIYRRIALPLSWPAFIITGVFQFTSIWNDFLFGVVLTKGSNQPASVVLANLLGTTAAEWNVQMAGTFIYALPVVAVYLLLGKYLIRGYLTGAIKG
ncbi:MAG: carbohydrate ABC transporter permease [Sulfolobales archaeon]|nr:carbohydrate ABC transporter permease [Sulfolobales archaeon]MCX8199148.1 carbohydrate ABC transporter permease [Sulfolobales archaeon]MDW8170128.1 carbohydrate ABC transporter permease [Desulfurococcaceae archaeon]